MTQNRDPHAGKDAERKGENRHDAFAKSGPARESDYARWNRRAFVIIVALAGVAIGLDYFVHLDPHFHPHFDWEKTFGFYGGWAVLSCAALLGIAKVWGWGTWRESDYYDHDCDSTSSDH